MIRHHSGPAALATLAVAVIAVGLRGCSSDEPGKAQAPPDRSEKPATAWVEIGKELFELELALDPRTRHRGLGGRSFISPTGGMLFVNRVLQPVGMVMRDCPIPIDVAFLDEDGRIVATHEMQPEPPRGPAESARQYEQRLPIYRSGAPARFSVEIAGGRLAEMGVGVGDLLVFDTREFLERAAATGSRASGFFEPDG
ncbi:MAG: DUF192 domain-containing protein [Myxococcota bacterium]